MKLIEWLIAISLVIIGVSCLTMSATSMMNPGSAQPYLYNLFRICMWIGIPAVIAAVLYLIFKRKKGDPK